MPYLSSVSTRRISERNAMQDNRKERGIMEISGQVEAVPVFMHHPDGKRGDRWLRTSTMTKVQLGNKIAMLRRQQHGYDIRLRVYETIYDLLPFEDAIVGSVIRVMRGDAVSTRRPD